jgi:hypothetical protein
MNLIQKISSHSDAQKGKQKSVLILLWQKINKNRSQMVHAFTTATTVDKDINNNY